MSTMKEVTRCDRNTLPILAKHLIYTDLSIHSERNQYSLVTCNSEMFSDIMGFICSFKPSFSIFSTVVEECYTDMYIYE